MLTEIEIQSFKCFQHLVLPLRPLTLLSGRNASGKSTVLQALVLLHQTVAVAELGSELRLNGKLIALGTAEDVIDKVTGRHEFGMTLTTALARCEWVFKKLIPNSMSIPLASARLIVDGRIATYDPQALSAPSTLHHLVPLAPDDAVERGYLVGILREIQYISAERLAPRETYPLTDSDVSARGENAPALIYRFSEKSIQGRLVLESAEPTLRHQVEAWMREFFPGCGLDVQLVPNANQVSLGLRTSDATTYHRPQHVGFGLTHVLPIITAALAAEPGQVILIENPEVHLHPAGQALMGQFLARVAAAGVQVLIETHSDHVLNGVRRAVREQALAPDDVAIHFFQERDRVAAEGLSQVVSPQIDDQGNIDHWPEGFFDQLDKDMSYFAGWGG